MKLLTSIRISFPSALALAAAGCVFLPGVAQQNVQRPALIERRAAAPPAPIQRQQPSPRVPANGGGKLQGEHIATWLDHHSSETTQQKLQSLEKEPGFHDLPQQTQQRMRDQLLKLESLPPEQRERRIVRTEAMERMTPDQRVQVRNTLQQVAALPPASRRAVQRTFRILRGMPPAQRQTYLNSPDIRSQFSDQEFDALQHLMAVEPLLPPGDAGSPSQ